MFPNFDPSKMDPRSLMELTELVRQLPPAQLVKMQQLMQKMMVGIDVRYELEQFERELPPGFREKLMALAGNPSETVETTAAEVVESAPSSSGPMDVRGARLTVLEAVASGEMTPEQAERILWPES